MFIVGLTGGLATGKSTVLSIFRDNGIAVIDADEVARKVLEPGTKAWMELREYFGDQVLCGDGKVNRVRLGEIVFDDNEKRRKLNAITHPRIQSAMMKMAISYFFSGHRYIVMEVPLLFETGKMLTFMHKIITVVCEDHQQLERLCKRSDFTEVVAKKRINCQMPLEQKVAKSHFVIDNSGDILNTRHQTESIIRVLRRSKFTWYFRAIFLIAFLSLIFGVAHIASNFLNSKI
ncbi:dephospho-CoA kinase domain-containing protein isoform X1 [Galleria mellonella]|uniref:Dephospho-CoA kinase domain-containing protein n=1 Tax=Galleria mellonella TaxID=7137 RepID=A0A6J1WY40_GALME|nr:dephospho-CoA kinase domain-containing protein isoform X1 [Galleria mellonella]